LLVGDLPEDFLRISPSTRQQQEAADEQAAMVLQQQMTRGFHPQNMIGKLHITVVQAELVKNYGVTRMDPYCRLRIGHTVYETHTDHNGARNPRWNKVIQCYLQPGVTSIYLEIFDECTFTMDEKIAWGHYNIPEAVLKGNTADDWFLLNGRQGDEKEGRINLVISFTPVHVNPVMYSPNPQVVVVPSNVYGLPYYLPGTAPPPPQVIITENDIKLIQEMFPNVDSEVVKSILEANKGSKDATINALLQISGGN